MTCPPLYLLTLSSPTSHLSGVRRAKGSEVCIVPYLRRHRSVPVPHEVHEHSVVADSGSSREESEAREFEVGVIWLLDTVIFSAAFDGTLALGMRSDRPADSVPQACRHAIIESLVTVLLAVLWHEVPVVRLPRSTGRAPQIRCSAWVTQCC